MSFRSSDISALLDSQPRPRAVHADDGPMEAAAQGTPQGTPQGAAEHTVVVAAVAGCAAAAVAAVAAVLVLIIRRRRRVRQQESDRAVIIRDLPGFMEASGSLDSSICRSFLGNFDTLSFVSLQASPPEELPSAVTTQ